MAMRGWSDVTAADIARMQRKDLPAPKQSKYRNVRVEVDGLSFDSKREANQWLRLKARELAGEIRNLRRQVIFPLLAPVASSPGVNVEVARYVADFCFEEVSDGRLCVVDAKGVKTALFKLKAKWLELQSGIVVETT